MQTTSALAQSQEPPRFRPPSPRGDETRDSLLGNSEVQVITLPVSNPNWRRDRLRLAWAASAPRDTIDRAERARSEFRWLAENRDRYSGRWIALDGNRLLAVGDSAREVYAAIVNYDGTPLVTRVEASQETYFAGW